jgi:hypothetical protein
MGGSGSHTCIHKSPAPQSAQERATELWVAIDRIFSTTSSNLLGSDFSFTIADPSLTGCPLIGCSAGFTNLCGYELRDVLGKNVDFLVDCVPADQLDEHAQKHTSDFCKAVSHNQMYKRPACDCEPWMFEGRPFDELVVVQLNARKDGSLFDNMFFMKVFDIGPAAGEEVPYIVVLHSEFAGGKEHRSLLIQNLAQLDAVMAQVKAELCTSFFVRCSVPTQHHDKLIKVCPDEDVHAPEKLHMCFPADEVQPWDAGKFKYVRKLADAVANRGDVHLMQDRESEEFVAVKRMPNVWTGRCHREFLQLHSSVPEVPWVDLGCTRFLNSINYTYACQLHGVYRSDHHTFVVSSFASEGDLYSFAQTGDVPGPQREAALAPLVVQLCSAVQLLHGFQIAHRDISLENVLLTKGNDGNLQIILCDFGMAATGRKFKNCLRGKASYTAPEMYADEEYDAFLSDIFAAGFVAFALLLRDFAWSSTEPGQCKNFEYVREHGLRAFCADRPVEGTGEPLGRLVSKPLMQLLEGMLMTDPNSRLTMGEKELIDRGSVWDEPWIARVQMN